MTINQGLLSLVNSSPNFSNQALENAINVLKNISGGFITKTFELDTAIDDNNVLTTTQKNDVKATINTRPYLNFGRYLNDVIKHTNTILDGSILPVVAGTENFPQGTFLEILQIVHSVQNLVPQLYGVSASEKSRDVNDHLGSLNNMFIDTEDSSKPVFTSLKETVTTLNTININAIGTDLPGTLDNLKAFINSVVSDSTDFQQTLNKFADEVKSDIEYIDLMLGVAGVLGTDEKRNTRLQLRADYEEIQVQINLEKSNVSGIRTYVETLSDNMGYTSLAEDTELRKLMARVSQTSEWQDYFENYETRKNNLNPVYNVGTDSDKITIIEQVMLTRGLPDVTDYVNLDAVATKTKNDSRIDTKDFEKKTSEQIITAASNQLGITTANRSIYNQSKELLNNMNDYDKQQISDELDANQTADTIT